MGCSCGERREAIAGAAAAALRGDLTALRPAAAQVGRTLAQDAMALARTIARRRPGAGR